MVCVMCHRALAGRQTKYCSPRCAILAENANRIASGRLKEQRVRAGEKRRAWMAANRGRYAGRYSYPEYENRRRRRKLAETRLRRAALGFKGRYRWTAGACLICGGAFVDWATTRTCSSECSKKLKQRRTNERKRAKYTALRLAVFERDGWVCAICGDPTNPTARVPDLDSAVVDHILPRTHGGSDEVDNLQCAHFYCNSVKGDKIGFTAAA